VNCSVVVDIDEGARTLANGSLDFCNFNRSALRLACVDNGFALSLAALRLWAVKSYLGQDYVASQRIGEHGLTGNLYAAISRRVADRPAVGQRHLDDNGWHAGRQRALARRTAGCGPGFGTHAQPAQQLEAPVGRPHDGFSGPADWTAGNHGHHLVARQQRCTRRRGLRHRQLP
jgi:hypothetical protein